MKKNKLILTIITIILSSGCNIIINDGNMKVLSVEESNSKQPKYKVTIDAIPFNLDVLTDSLYYPGEIVTLRKIK